MALATLFNIPADQSDLLVFSFSNMDHHRLIASQLAVQKGITVPLFPLDPMPLNDLAGWAEIHQQAHRDFTNALGIAGVDLTDVDFNNPAQLASFMILHANEHRQADIILGLGS